jgi:hypothetical protein
MLAKWEKKEYNKLEDTDYKMEEYVRVPKDEYDELKQIKKGIETLKTNGLPDDTQFILMTKEDYERNNKKNRRGLL